MAEHRKEHDSHDSHDKHGYTKRCYCQKCKKTYDEWCKQHKEEGCTTCQRKCVTICEIKCEKPIKKIVKWGYRQEFEGEWEAHKGKPAPKHCKTCDKPSESCKCKKHH